MSARWRHVGASRGHFMVSIWSLVLPGVQFMATLYYIFLLLLNWLRCFERSEQSSTIRVHLFSFVDHVLSRKQWIGINRSFIIREAVLTNVKDYLRCNCHRWCSSIYIWSSNLSRKRTARRVAVSRAHTLFTFNQQRCLDSVHAFCCKK